MAPRNPSRPKASDLSDLDALLACEQYADKGLPHPLDCFPEMPRKVVAAKLHKLSDRGWIGRDSKITKTGRTVLTEAE